LIISYIFVPIKTDFINLRHPAIDVLLKYDEKTNTQYLKTLKIYIDCLGNMSEAAQILKIHYNTMKHRIKTIENLTSISLKDTVTFLNIFISFRINEGLKDDFFKYE
jgi:purine catabolism regulator